MRISDEEGKEMTITQHIRFERACDVHRRKALVHDLRRCDEMVLEMFERKDRVLEEIMEIDEKWGEL